MLSATKNIAGIGGPGLEIIMNNILSIDTFLNAFRFVSSLEYCKILIMYISYPTNERSNASDPR